MRRHSKSVEHQDESIAPGLHDRLLNKLGQFWGEVVFWAICLVLTAMVLYAILYTIALVLVTPWNMPLGAGPG